MQTVTALQRIGTKQQLAAGSSWLKHLDFILPDIARERGPGDLAPGDHFVESQIGFVACWVGLF